MARLCGFITLLLFLVTIPAFALDTDSETIGKLTSYHLYKIDNMIKNLVSEFNDGAHSAIDLMNSQVVQKCLHGIPLLRKSNCERAINVLNDHLYITNRRLDASKQIVLDAVEEIEDINEHISIEKENSEEVKLQKEKTKLLLTLILEKIHQKLEKTKILSEETNMTSLDEAIKECSSISLKKETHCALIRKIKEMKAIYKDHYIRSRLIFRGLLPIHKSDFHHEGKLVRVLELLEHNELSLEQFRGDAEEIIKDAELLWDPENGDITFGELD